MKEALIEKIDSLPEEIQELLLLIPIELLILLLEDPETIKQNAQQIDALESPDRPPEKIPTLGAFEGQMVMSDDFDDPIPGFDVNQLDDSQLRNLQK